MALSQEDVRGIADYARIALSSEELAAMTSYMNDAVAMLEPIKGLAEKAEPTSHPIGGLVNVMRPDEVAASLELEDAFYNAAATQGRYFRVSQILSAGDEDAGDR